RASRFIVRRSGWTNPLKYQDRMSRRELDMLRSGWDLVIDVDVPDWELARLSAFLVVEALYQCGVEGVTCKFSGNKGFHVGVPWEAFPDAVGSQPMAAQFPELPRRIVAYLLEFISSRLTEEQGDEAVFAGSQRYAKSRLASLLGVSEQDLFLSRCRRCHERLRKGVCAWDYVCSSCDKRLRLERKSERVVCPDCQEVMLVLRRLRSRVVVRVRFRMR
ncbi:MAG: hypothetical protein HC945_01335, partial [Nitrosarchaeum sp.]|nr:hypothetical protein [Nitrosarchaeum sp.]